MAEALATLAGLPLEMDRAISWPITVGVAPSVRAFTVHKDTAADLMAQAGEPVTLEVAGSGDGEGFKVEGLRILEESPAQHPDRRTITVADARVYWPWAWVSRSMNIRRQQSRLVVVGDDDVVAADQLRVEEAYAKYSLQSSTIASPMSMAPFGQEAPTLTILTPYDVGAALSTVLADVDPDLQVVFDVDLQDRGVIEDVELDSTGDDAVAEVLREIAGVDVFLDLEGRLHVFDTATPPEYLEDVAFRTMTQAEAAEGGGGEDSERAFFFPGVPGSRAVDLPAQVDRSGVRPEFIRVMFTAAIEVKYAYDEADPLGDVPRNLDEATLPIYAHNVLQSPDPQLLVDGSPFGGSDGMKVLMGAWHEIGDVEGESSKLIKAGSLLDAWSKDEGNKFREIAGAPLMAGPLTQETIRHHFATGFQYIQHHFTRFGTSGGIVNPIWAGRLAAVRRCWRTHFMIDRAWWGAIRSVEDRRVAVYHEGLGTRAVSYARLDYTTRATLLELVKAEGDRSALKYGSVVKAKSEGDINQNGAVVASHWRVRLVDPDVGVFAFTAPPDLTGLSDLYIPGIPQPVFTETAGPDTVAFGVPEVDPTAAHGDVNVPLIWSKIRLKGDFAADGILTTVFGRPNNNSRFHSIRVDPSDAAEKLAGVTGADLRPTGPPMDVHVPASIMRARFAWVDGLTDRLVLNKIREADPEDPGRLTASEMAEILTNDDILEDIAKAIGASVYEGRLDRIETRGAETHLAPELVPQGPVRSIEHTLRTDGALTTTIRAPKVGRALGFLRYLNPEIRKAVTRSLQNRER